MTLVRPGSISEPLVDVIRARGTNVVEWREVDKGDGRPEGKCRVSSDSTSSSQLLIQLKSKATEKFPVALLGPPSGRVR